MASTTILPGPVRQVGYVVRDLDRTIDAWLGLGVGPWLTLRHQAQTGCTYRGQPCDVTLSLAFANSGDLQLELIQPDDATPSIYTEFLDAGREGYHQLAWWVEDFDAVMAAAGEAGWPVAFAGDGGGAARYAYLEPPGGVSTVAEVMELTDATRWMAERIRAAADGWDGQGPAVQDLF